MTNDNFLKKSTFVLKMKQHFITFSFEIETKTLFFLVIQKTKSHYIVIKFYYKYIIKYFCSVVFTNNYVIIKSLIV